MEVRRPGISRPVGYESAIWAKTMSRIRSAPYRSWMRTTSPETRSGGRRQEREPATEHQHPIRRRGARPRPTARRPPRPSSSGEEVEHRRPAIPRCTSPARSRRSAIEPERCGEPPFGFVSLAPVHSRPTSRFRTPRAREPAFGNEPAARRLAAARPRGHGRFDSRSAPHQGAPRRRPSRRRPRSPDRSGSSTSRSIAAGAACAPPRSRLRRRPPRRPRRTRRPRASAVRTYGTSDDRRRSRPSWPCAHGDRSERRASSQGFP